jgi:hypothetical protein
MRSSPPAGPTDSLWAAIGDQPGQLDCNQPQFTDCKIAQYTTGHYRLGTSSLSHQLRPCPSDHPLLHILPVPPTCASHLISKELQDILIVLPIPALPPHQPINQWTSPLHPQSFRSPIPPEPHCKRRKSKCERTLSRSCRLKRKFVFDPSAQYGGGASQGRVKKGLKPAER